MFLARPIHSVKFLEEQNLGVEAHIGRYDALPNWDQYIPFVKGVHLPYGGLNLAALDPEERANSIKAVQAAIENACQYPVDRMVIHSIGLESIESKLVGAYDLLIESFKTLADFAAEKEIILCLENQVFTNPKSRRIYGAYAAEWRQILYDVDKANLMLTLDTSHAATSAAIYQTQEKRLEALWDFLAVPELIGRVHWTDARINNQEAKFHDMHLVNGTGDLPREFHKKIKELPVIKLIELNCSEEEMAQAMKFVHSLE